jgi:hypothetical protein
MDISGISGAGDDMAAAMVAREAAADEFAAPAMVFDVVCYGPDGAEKWREKVRNLVLTAGKTDLVDKYLKGAAYTAAWYICLKGAGSIAAGDTLASHAGWTELQPYAGTNRPLVTWGTTAAGSNTAAGVTINFNATATIAGAGVTNAQTGTSGVLYNMSDFASARSVLSGDSLVFTPTITVT